MPLKKCKVGSKEGWRWGGQKCFVGKDAKKKAARQAAAIYASGYVKNARRMTVSTNPSKYDPTRSIVLRQAFMRELSVRYASLKRAVRELVVEQDAFGLKNKWNNLTIVNAEAPQFQFETSEKQVEAFQGWLKTQISEKLESDDAYWEKYVSKGYEKGLNRSFDDTNRVRKTVAQASDKMDSYTGSKSQFLMEAFGQPETVAKVKLLASRTLTDLKGVNATMAAQMSRVLVDGLVQGKGPEEIAKEINQRANVALSSAQRIARTEIVRAHAEGQLDALEKLGIEEVGVMVEWDTANDGRVCKKCSSLQGIVLKISEAHNLIPRHPNCRCAFIPANVGEKAEGQVRSKDEIDAAMEKSTALDGKKSTWAGQGTRISTKRPLSIFTKKPPWLTQEQWDKKLEETFYKGEATAPPATSKPQEKLKETPSDLTVTDWLPNLVHDKEIIDKMASETDDDNKADRLARISSVMYQHINTPLSKKKYWKFVYVKDKNGNIVAAGSLQNDVISQVGSITKGGGKKVIEALENKAKEKGFKRVELEASDENKGFYEKLGYSVFDSAEGSYFMEKVFGVPKPPEPAPILEDIGDQLKKMDKAHGSVGFMDLEVMGWDSKNMSFGGVMFDDKGRILLREPVGHFGGYAWTFAKGTPEGNMSALKTALKEVSEETGHKGQVMSAITGSFEGTQSNLGMFVMRSTGFDAKKMDKETANVRWVTKREAMELINMSMNAQGKARDLKILEAAFQELEGLKKGVRNPVFEQAIKVGYKKKFAKKAEKPKPLKEGEFPNPQNLKHIKTLPGSTRPELMEAPDGSKWVVKSSEGNHDHVRSEALADEMYRAAGYAVPKSGLIEDAGGPIKVSEYLDKGQTLNDYMSKASATEKEAMRKQIQEGFVMDALMGNWDVVGLNADNILVKGGKAYRIDNGGSLLFRAQGTKKRDFGPIVSELETMLDSKTNSSTAKIFKGITDKDIANQVQKISSNRQKILGTIKDAKLRSTIDSRISYLEDKYKTEAVKVKTTMTERIKNRVAEPGIAEGTAERVGKSRAVGVTIQGDTNLIEDNNILAWEEKDDKGSAVTKLQFKVTRRGSGQIEKFLQEAGADLADDLLDEDWNTILAGVKTVGTHHADGKYNQATMTKLVQFKNETQKAIKEGKFKGPTLDMKQYYLGAADLILDSAEKKKVPTKISQWKGPKSKKAEPRIRAEKRDGEFRVSKFNNGRITGTNESQSVGMGAFVVIEPSDDVEVRFFPRGNDAQATTGLAMHGTVTVTVKGNVTNDSMQKALQSIKAMGIDTTANSEYEELMYLHKTIYLRKDDKLAAYKDIMDSEIPVSEKIKKVKAWAAKKYKVDFDNMPHYKPEGQSMDGFGNGFRYWNRWDVSPDEMQKEMGNYVLSHSVGSDLKDTINGVLQSGGDITSTTQRIRKGVKVGNVGMSAHRDIETGGASYFFTRIREKNKPSGQLNFKPSLLMRADAISYNGDKFGRISAVRTRLNTIEQYQKMPSFGSNETIFKHGLSLLDDLDFVMVRDEEQKQDVIKVFHDNKVTHLNDGRKVEDVVKTQKEVGI